MSPRKPKYQPRHLDPHGSEHVYIDDSTDTWIQIVIGVIAVAFFAGLAVYYGSLNHAILTRGEIATATVVDYSYSRTSDKIYVDYTVGGNTHHASTTAFLETPDIGENVEIIYDPLDFSNVQASDWGADYFSAITLGALAVAALVYTLFYVIRLIRHRKHSGSHLSLDSVDIPGFDVLP